MEEQERERNEDSQGGMPEQPQGAKQNHKMAQR